MKKTIKTSDILNAYNVLKMAKYSAMEDADKIKAWKIARALKPIATKFDDDSKDAAEKLKPEIDGGFDEVLGKVQEYERMVRDTKADMTKLPMGAAEYNAFITKLKEYNKLVGKAVEEFANAENEIDFEPLSEAAFVKLIASNDWTVGQVEVLGDIVCE